MVEKEIITKLERLELREKCPNTEFFLVRIFPYLDCIQRDTESPPVFIPNVGKQRSEKTLYLDTCGGVDVKAVKESM